MDAALEQARLGLAAGEVPIGAVLVIDDEIVARGYNQPISACDPTAPAEGLVMRDGALIHARVRTVVYGAAEPKTGALVSTVRALDTPGLNHRFTVAGGVRGQEARELIQEFFREKRRL